MKLKYLIPILLPVCAAAQIGLGLSPMRHEVKMAAGGQMTGVLDLSNESARPMRVLAELLDFSIDQNTTPQFALALPAEERWSCRSWIGLNPMMAEMDAKGHLNARYTVRVPRDTAPGTYHCAIGYMSVPPPEEISASSMVTRVRVISAFYILVGDYQPAGHLKGLSLEHVPDASGGRWVAVVTVENAGNFYFRAQGNVELLDEAGGVIQKVAMNSTAILPLREQRIVVPITGVEAARKNQLRAMVDLSHIGVEEASAQVVANSR